jgi:hypothetical protein
MPFYAAVLIASASHVDSCSLLRFNFVGAAPLLFVVQAPEI